MEVSELFALICNSCKKEFHSFSAACPHCQTTIILEGAGKNISETFVPDCLIHRYRGSDLLEPAVVLKKGKTNLKIAIRAKDLAKPITVPKDAVFQYDETIFRSVCALRDDRCETMRRYDAEIGAYWNKLTSFDAKENIAAQTT